MPQPARHTSKPTVFLSYSPQDEKWKDRLLAHLRVLEREGSFEIWEDRQIAAGAGRVSETQAALERARVAILLISTDFLNSEFLRGQQVPFLLERRDRAGVRVIPVIVRSCPWASVPSLSALQALPRGGKALADFKGAERDRVLTDIALEIQALLAAEAGAPAEAGPPPGPPLPGKASREPVRILLLSANPDTSHPLELEEEAREIERAWRLGELRDRFELLRYHAVRPTDLEQFLLQHRPHLVHFSGHGDVEGICLQGEKGQIQPVPGALLERLFEHFQRDLRCVVLNACFSSLQAPSIARVVDCVVGMSAKITDRAAIRFAGAFHQALSFGRDVQAAFELGRLQIDLADLRGGETPTLLAERCDPATVVFAS